MNQDERPVHLVLDCGPGKTVTATPLTDEAWAVHRQAEAEGDARARAAAEQAAADRQRVAALASAHPDPLVQELARRAGVLP